MLFALAGCTRSEPADQTALVVFAASSLTEAFRDLADGFEAAHPNVDVQLTFAGSQVLRFQIEQGAAADVFASANERHMAALVESKLVLRSRTFAQNELVVIVPPDNPAQLERFDQLEAASRLVVGTDLVPVGRYTRKMLERAKDTEGEAFVTAVSKNIVSEESNVRLVRAKVELGEADAAVVYRTDVSDAVRVIPIPDAINVRAHYPIGQLTGANHPNRAAKFIDYVLSTAGRQILGRHGFLVKNL